MSETTPQKAPRKGAGRSKIARQSTADMDGRGKWVKRLAELIEGYSQEISDDPASLPTSTQVMISRIATLTVALEREDETFLKADKADPKETAAYQTAAGSLRRLLSELQVSVGTPERIHRADPTRHPTNVRLVRKVQEDMSTDDWRLAHGDLIPKEAGRETARLIALALSRAQREGGADLGPELTAFAESMGYTAVNDRDNVVDLTEYRQEDLDRALL